LREGMEFAPKTNSLAMIDKERTLAKPAGSKRIAMLGDSFIAGLGVKPEDRVNQVMEKLLPSGWEALNFGVPGFGTTQELILLRERVLGFSPDVVVVVIYIGNDFDDIMGTLDWFDVYSRARPIARLDPSGSLVWTNIPVPKPRPGTEKTGLRYKIHCLLQASHLYNFLDSQMIYLKSRVELVSEVRLCKIRYSAETATAYSLMARLIAELKSLSEAGGTKFGVVIAPTIVQVYGEARWGPIRNAFKLPADEYDLSLPDTKIKEACKSANCPVLDLMPALKSAFLKGTEPFYPLNRHWNADGHRLVAEEICRWLTDLGWTNSAH
jgi:lysophospholipase L1-like esterase